MLSKAIEHEEQLLAAIASFEARFKFDTNRILSGSKVCFFDYEADFEQLLVDLERGYNTFGLGSVSVLLAYLVMKYKRDAAAKYEANRELLGWKQDMISDYDVLSDRADKLEKTYDELDTKHTALDSKYDSLMKDYEKAIDDLKAEQDRNDEYRDWVKDLEKELKESEKKECPCPSDHS